MAIDRKTVFDEMKGLFGTVPTWVRSMPPQAVGGFWEQMRDFELAETTIPRKYKELIGVAVSGATRCRYCALFHTEGARLNGATEEELAEAAAMAALTMGGSTFLNAQQIDYDEFRRETLEMIAYARAHLQPAPTRPAGARAHA